MYISILAGGSGSRLRPVSTQTYPKQFVSLLGDKTLIQNTVDRFLWMVTPDAIAISTNETYASLVKEQLSKQAITNIVTEPAKRNTMGAILLMMRYLEDVKRVSSDSLLLIAPSDHYIHPVDRFVAYVQQWAKIAQEGKIVLFGVMPDRPETWFGYIKVNESDLTTFSVPIEAFVEKPNYEKAKEYVDSGMYFWNAWIFLFRIDVMKREMEKFVPEISDFFSLSYDELIAKFQLLPDISIDYAVMEKTKDAVVIPMNINRSDLGSWDNVRDKYDKDENQNVIQWNVKQFDCHNTLIISTTKKIVVDWADDMCIVESEEWIYIGKRGRSQRVKDLL